MFSHCSSISYCYIRGVCILPGRQIPDGCKHSQFSLKFELRSVSGGGRRCRDHDGAGSLGGWDPASGGVRGGGVERRSVRPGPGGPGPPGAAASRQVGRRGPRGGGPTARSLAFASGGAALRSVDSPWRGGGGVRRTPRGGWRGPRGSGRAWRRSAGAGGVRGLRAESGGRSGRGCSTTRTRRGVDVDSRRGGLRGPARRHGSRRSACAAASSLLRLPRRGNRAAVTAPR